MSEKSMWGRVRVALRNLDPVRVENRVELGTPDVNLSNGIWIELKWVRTAPKREGIVHVEHYSMEQKCWHERRIRAGGKVYVLIKISNEWIILNGLTAIDYLGKVPLDKLREVAIKVWKVKLNDQELREILTSS